MYNRYDLYGPVHKGLRYALSGICYQAGSIRSAIQPHAMMIFLHYMLPAISHQDRAAMLGGMKLFAPQEAYEAVLRLAEARLEPQNWSALKSEMDNMKQEVS